MDNDENKKYYDIIKESLNDNENEDFKDVNEQNKIEKNYKNIFYDEWQPKWVRLSMFGTSLLRPVDVNDKLTYVQKKNPDGFVDVPENLADDVLSGKLDPTLYTIEQLEEMSIRKHLMEIEYSQNNYVESVIDEKDEENSHKRHR